MMSRILLVTESGADLAPEIAKEYGVTVVPMHVTYGGQTRDDGAFPVGEMFAHYKTTKELPKTSGCTPSDFETVFDRLQREEPDAQILYLAYSACTTCSMQSALIAAQDRKNITAIDTKSVTAGQGAIVLRVAKLLREHPETTMEEAVAEAKRAIESVKMGFFPGDLDYLRAGGRVSNAAYLGARILSLHPLIEILDGKLMSTKKYRGAMDRVVRQLAEKFPDEQQLDRSVIYPIYGEGLDAQVMRDVEQILRGKGFKEICWVKTGCVIAAHSGPGAFGIAGFTA